MSGGGEVFVGAGITVVNYKRVTPARVRSCRMGPSIRVCTLYSVVGRQTTTLTRHCNVEHVIASTGRVFTGSRVSTISVYAPRFGRTRLYVRTLRTNGSMVYRGPLTGAVGKLGLLHHTRHSCPRHVFTKVFRRHCGPVFGLMHTLMRRKTFKRLLATSVRRHYLHTRDCCGRST